MKVTIDEKGESLESSPPPNQQTEIAEIRQQLAEIRANPQPETTALLQQLLSKLEQLDTKIAAVESRLLTPEQFREMNQEPEAAAIVEIEPEPIAEVSETVVIDPPPSSPPSEPPANGGGIPITADANDAQKSGKKKEKGPLARLIFGG